MRSLYYDSARQDLGIRFAGDWGNLVGETIYEMEGATATAVNEALRAAESDSASSMQQLTGGLNLPF